MFMSVNIFQNDSIFLQGDKDNNLGETIWIGSIMTNTVHNQFQKQPLWISDKCIELDGIRLYAKDIALPIQWYE